MKRIFSMMLMLTLIALMSGCVQMKMDTDINKDGSGTMDLTVSLSAVVTEAINEMGADSMDGEMEDIGKLMSMNEKEFKKSIKDLDVDLVKFKQGPVDGKETVQLKLKFKDLENLSLALRELMGGEEQGLAILDNGDGNFVLRPHEYNWPAKADQEEDGDDAEDMDDMANMDPEKMQQQMALMGKLMEAMGELDISMKMTVPGDIIESNAPTVEGRTSTWSINSSNMMSGETNMEPNIVFSGEGLKIKAIK